jgi:hypothetical protein
MKNTERIIKVKNVACHCYDGRNCETAIYAKSDSRPGYRWYVGYGGDKLPASKRDLDNMTDYRNQAAELSDAQECYADGHTVVQKYRRA